jgi:hypothetical protein
MRLAEIVQVKNGVLQIPSAFERPLELYSGSEVYHAYTEQKRPYHPPHRILTTIPPECWPRILKLSILLTHEKPGALSIASRILSELGINILIMEGYGRDPDDEGWWSAVVDCPNSDLRKTKKILIQKFFTVLEEESKARRHGNDNRPFMYSPRFTTAKEKEEQFKQVPHGIESSEGTRPFLVEDMILTSLHGQVFFEGHTPPGYKKVPYGKGCLRIAEGGSHTGLLLCNTEERFLRLVEFPRDRPFPIEMELPVRTSGERTEDVGVGILAEITRIISGAGINIIYTYNYISRREQKKGKGADIERDVEESVIRFFLEPRPTSQEESKGKDAKKELFVDLLNAKRRNEFVVSPPEQARMTIRDGNRKTVWRGKIHRQTGKRVAIEVRLLWRIWKIFGRKERVFLVLGAICLLLGTALLGSRPGAAAVAFAFGGAVVSSLLGLFLRDRGKRS